MDMQTRFTYCILLTAHAICLVQNIFLHQKKPCSEVRTNTEHRHKSSNNSAQKKTVNKHCAAPQGIEILNANIQKASAVDL